MTTTLQTVVLKSIILTLFFVPTITVTGAEQEYALGHGALEVFGGDGFKQTPTWVQAWVGFMLATFAVGLFFSWKHPLARWVVSGLVLSASCGGAIFAFLGLPFLGGSIAITHLVFWTPALIFLLIKRPFFNMAEPTAFRVWSAVITGVIIFSFVFDIRDAAVYILHIRGLV
jgi:hypothetical protein